MFRDQKLVKPQTSSIVGALLLAPLLYLGGHSSPYIGYLLAVGTLIIITVAVLMTSVWPTRAKPENRVVFALFWGAILGLILPLLVMKFLEGGFAALYELLTG